MREYPARARGLWVVPFAVADFAVRRDRGRLKSRLIRAILGGLTRGQIAALTRHFLDRHWTSLFHTQALAALEGHRASGDRLVILSASIDHYVADIGARLGVAEVICTQLTWRGDRLEGALATPNRRGPEKTRCIEGLRLRHPGASFSAYGNSGSDIEHLVAVDAGVLVNGSAATRRRAAALGLACVDWS